MSLDPTLLQESFALVAAKELDLASRFYEILFERYPQTRPMFRRRPEEQAKMLTAALAAVVAHVEDTAWLVATLPPMGAKHVSYGVTNEMYDWVGECLIAALEDVCGKDFTPAVKATWFAAFGAVASLMQSGAASVTQPSSGAVSHHPASST
ncbi:MAG: globin domain-containing protein [Labilithrix sp.]